MDGSVSDDLPTKRLARLYGVNHYIVSQANPAVLPFVTDGHRQRGTLGILTNASRRTAREWLNAGAAIMHKPLSRESAFSRSANMLLSMVNQDYVGDINIMPRNRFYNPLKLLSRLSAEEVVKLVASGERSAWRRMDMIRVQTRISRSLDRIVKEQEEEILHASKPRNPSGDVSGPRPGGSSPGCELAQLSSILPRRDFSRPRLVLLSIRFLLALLLGLVGRRFLGVTVTPLSSAC